MPKFHAKYNNSRTTDRSCTFEHESDTARAMDWDDVINYFAVIKAHKGRLQLLCYAVLFRIEMEKTSRTTLK